MESRTALGTSSSTVRNTGELKSHHRRRDGDALEGLVEFRTDDGAVIVVEAAEDESGSRLVARGDDGAVRATRTFELDHEVPFKPAEFASSADAHGDPPRRLLAYGFPKRYDEGTLAEYRATADQLIAGEWVQLEAWAAHGQPLAPGFSGAAVTLADTGRVVGMVSAAARDPGVRNGLMLPAHVGRPFPAGCTAARTISPS